MQKLNIRIKIAIVFGVFLLSTSFLQAQKKVKTKEQAKESEYLVAAYVWPSCHDDSLGSAAVGLFGPKVQTLAGEWQILQHWILMSNLHIKVPPLTIDKLPCKHALTFRIENIN
jgi:hypothetical protein